MSDVHPALIKVRAARRVSLESREKFLEAVKAASKAGLSYSEIGEYANCSRQAIHQLLQRNNHA